MTHATIVIALLTAFALTPAAAQQPGSCRLLLVAEIEAAIGGKASAPPARTTQSVPGMTADECSVEIPGPSRAVHLVSIQVVTGLPMDGGAAIRNRNTGTAREAQWTASGARLEQETVGNAICILTGRPNVAGHTICSVPRGKGYVEVDVSGSFNELVSMATVRSLLQKAMTRL